LLIRRHRRARREFRRPEGGRSRVIQVVPSRKPEYVRHDGDIKRVTQGAVVHKRLSVERVRRVD
jgi:hypothetical protein